MGYLCLIFYFFDLGQNMYEDILVYWQSFYGLIRKTLKMWTKPATALLVASALSDINRSRTDLIIENAMLRQQLIVLNR